MRVNDVPISNGGVWIKEAFTIFCAQPLQWIALMFAWVLTSLAFTVELISTKSLLVASAVTAASPVLIVTE